MATSKKKPNTGSKPKVKAKVDPTPTSTEKVEASTQVTPQTEPETQPKDDTTVSPPTEKKAKTPKKDDRPAFLKKPVTSFVVGTLHYRELVGLGNKLFGSKWNVHRVRPAIFQGMYKQLNDHYDKS